MRKEARGKEKEREGEVGREKGELRQSRRQAVVGNRRGGAYVTLCPI